jgi:hypothetical protein
MSDAISAAATPKKSYAKDPRLVTVQVPKFSRDIMDSLEKKYEFRTRYVAAAALQAFSQLDTDTQLNFLRDAQAKYIAAGEPAA